MKARHSLQTQEKCGECRWRTGSFFCDLPEPVINEFHALKITHSYPTGTTLFIEGQPANGVYFLCSGRVKLSTYSEDGRVIIVRIVEPGEILGLSASIIGISHEATAEVIENCQVNFIKRNEFLEFIREHGEASLKALEALSGQYHKAHTQICSLGLSGSVSDKLAKLFLEWYDRCGDGQDGVSIPMSYTHEEIAEMIGTSRETVTRLLKDFKSRALITLRQSELHIPDRKRLAASIGTRHRS